MFKRLAAFVAVGVLAVAGSEIAGTHFFGNADATTKVEVLAKVDNYNMKSIRHCNRPEGSPVLATFDDFGTPDQVKEILNKLDQNNMKAAFFPVGQWAEKHMDLINEMKARGHIVGNHTYSHARLGELAKTDEAAFYKEIYPLEGVANTSPMLLRPPHEDGAYTLDLANKLNSKNIQECTWSVDTNDWTGVTVEQIINHLKVGDTVLPPLQPGDVVLFHMFCGIAPQLIDAFANYLRQNNIPYETIHS